MHLCHFSTLTSFEPALLIPLAAIAGGVVIVFLSMYFSHERRRLWHDTVRLALEKGQPLPPALLNPARRQPRDPWCDLRSALILFAVALGLYYGLRSIGHGPQLIGAYITGGVGLALLLNALLGFLLRKNPSPTAESNRAPHA